MDIAEPGSSKLGGLQALVQSFAALRHLGFRLWSQPKAAAVEPWEEGIGAASVGLIFYQPHW